MTEEEAGRADAIIDAINRVADAIEGHHKVQSKIIHVLGFKLEDIKRVIEEKG